MVEAQKNRPKSIVGLFGQIAGRRSVSKASAAAATKAQEQRERFEAERRKIEESMSGGARLTKHRITL